MGKVEIGTILTIIGMMISFVFSYLVFWKNSKNENKKDGENKGTITSDIGYIKAGIDDLKKEQKETREGMLGFSERLTRCEESTKQAHKRIDCVEKG